MGYQDVHGDSPFHPRVGDREEEVSKGERDEAAAPYQAERSRFQVRLVSARDEHSAGWKLDSREVNSLNLGG
jgi:hypothetical protein